MLTLTDDRKDFDELAARLADFAGLAGAAGLFEQVEATKGGRHEFGVGGSESGIAGPGEDTNSPGVAARPFLGPSTDAAIPRLQSLADVTIGAVVDLKRTATKALDVMAEEVAEAAQTYIEAGRVGGPELSEQAKRNDPRQPGRRTLPKVDPDADTADDEGGLR